MPVLRALVVPPLRANAAVLIEMEPKVLLPITGCVFANRAAPAAPKTKSSVAELPVGAGPPTQLAVGVQRASAPPPFHTKVLVGASAVSLTVVAVYAMLNENPPEVTMA